VHLSFSENIEIQTPHPACFRECQKPRLLEEAQELFHCNFNAMANYNSWAACEKATHLKAILHEHLNAQYSNTCYKIHHIKNRFKQKL
jgi:hypothetical protein